MRNTFSFKKKDNRQLEVRRVEGNYTRRFYLKRPTIRLSIPEGHSGEEIKNRQGLVSSYLVNKTTLLLNFPVMVFFWRLATYRARKATVIQKLLSPPALLKRCEGEKNMPTKKKFWFP